MRTVPLLLLAVIARPAAAETRTFATSGFEDIRAKGPYRFEVQTGVAPYVRAEGSGAALSAIDVRVEGRTLFVSPGTNDWGGYPGQRPGPVTIRIGTHDLNSAVLSGPGSLAIDRVKAFEFALGVAGSGMASIADVESDRLKLTLAGGGGIDVAGAAKALDATVLGLSTLHATSLIAKDAKLTVSGPAHFEGQVTGTATVGGSGSGSVAFTGDPACTLNVEGSGSISGCRE